MLAAQSGDPHARHDLVQQFLPLIGGVARTYRGLPSIERRELIQEGVLGLLRALERYDPALGTPFWSYASWWVRQAMQRLVSELSGSFVLSDRAFRQIARIRDAERRHLQTRGRQPSPREIAEETELSVEQVQSLTSAQRRPRGLDEPAPGTEPSSATLVDSVADSVSEDGYERVCQKVAASLVPQLLEALDERERSILRGRYGLDGKPRSLRELGEELGVSAERVRQIETASLEKLRSVALSEERAQHPLGGATGTRREGGPHRRSPSRSSGSGTSRIVQRSGRRPSRPGAASTRRTSSLPTRSTS